MGHRNNNEQMTRDQTLILLLFFIAYKQAYGPVFIVNCFVVPQMVDYFSCDLAYGSPSISPIEVYVSTRIISGNRDMTSKSSSFTTQQK